MATDKELDELRAKIRGAIEDTLAMPVHEWAVKGEYGAINFEESLPTIGRVRDLVKMLEGFNLDYISHARLNALQSAIDLISKTFQKINSFSLNVANPSQQRDAIINELQNNYDGWFDAISPVVAFAIRNQTDFAQVEQTLKRRIADVEKTSGEAVARQTKLLEDAETTLSAIKKAAAEAGVSQEAVHFKEQADEHRTASRSWLLAMIGMAVATAMWGVIALWFLPVQHGADNAQIIHDAVAKIIIFTALYYALLWCARNFMASRHNYVVNRHRQNSLSTFESFVKAAEADAAIKNAVLLQATTSIFNSQSSGYGPSAEDGESPNKIIEIIRSFSDKTK
ncbi:MAG: hypothetical protein GEU95_24875 [Rhizobiales bacterium]|nr:hypothetical protein [Hyphomicrobiales bacterium]